MKVRVRLFSTLAQYSPTPGGEFTMEVKTSAQVSELLEALKLPPTVERLVLVNGRHAKSVRELQNGDKVTLFPPLTGG